jgi:CopA family copper-resistance protein
MDFEQRNRMSHLEQPSRRIFVKGLAMGGVAAGLGLGKRQVWAQATSRQPTDVLSGTEFDLHASEALVNFTGAPRFAHTVNGSLPAPILRWREGDTVTLRVANRLLDDYASIHWHGILLPANMDGVPGLSFNGIAPGETYVYRFRVKQSGTYWYHSHSAFQEQLGLYGALIIDPRDPEPFHYDRDHVVLLSDWTDDQPERVFAKLKKPVGLLQPSPAHGHRLLPGRPGARAARHSV